VVLEWIRSVRDRHVELLARREPGEPTYITKLFLCPDYTDTPMETAARWFLALLTSYNGSFHTLSLKKPNILTTQHQLQKYINTTISRMSEPNSIQNLTEYQMPSPPSKTSLMGVDIAWSGPAYPSFYSTLKIEIPSPPPSLTSKDTIKMLVESMSLMLEHLPSGREVSLLPLEGMN
jgi:hypothetical protein